MTTAKFPRRIRPGEPGDRSFVVDSWLKSYRDSAFARRLPSDAYWSKFGHVGLVEHLVGTTGFAVACLPEDPSFIYGWACVGDGVLHYVFVRRDFQRDGIGRELLAAVCPTGPLRVTHSTLDFQHLAAGRDVLFVNPYEKKAA